MSCYNNQSLMMNYLSLMDSSRNFWSIRVFIFVISPHSILLIDLERGLKNVTYATKRGISYGAYFLFLLAEPLSRE
jgi:hypothetical protein